VTGTDEAPLHGVRVLDFTMNLPGPYATLLLASLGADVIKIEPPRGDTARMTPSLFEIVNAGKRSCVVDLKDPQGARTAMALVAEADVLVEGFRPGVMARLGLGADATTAANPGLVYCSLSGYGQDGPYLEYPGHDLNFQALTGVCDMSRDAGEHPLGSALPIADLTSAMTAVSAITAALFGRVRTGRGRVIDVAMIDTLRAWTHAWAEGLTPSDARASDRVAAIARRIGAATGGGTLGAMVEVAAGWLGRDEIAAHVDAIGRRIGSTKVARNLVRLRLHALPHYGLFETRDRRWISIAIVDEDKFWRALCEGLALPRLAGIPLAGRMIGAAPLRRWVARAIATRDLDEWLRRFDRARVPVAPVVRIQDVANDPQIAWRAAAGGATGAPMPLWMRTLGPAPRLGEHTAAVLDAVAHAG
jgi:crotonobetainyl-CoA:carnitine CoA-transferase CaiB-like acyl-CoA transferase